MSRVMWSCSCTGQGAAEALVDASLHVFMTSQEPDGREAQHCPLTTCLCTQLGKRWKNGFALILYTAFRSPSPALPFPVARP